MSKLRWNVRMGPLQFTSLASLIGVAVGGLAVMLCCCGAWFVGVTN